MKQEFGAGGIILNNEKIALVFQRTTQTWSFPKGHIIPGKTLEETARREIYEEIGIKDMALIKKIGTYSRGSKKSLNLQKNVTIFLFKPNDIRLTSHDKENPTAKWVPIEKVAETLSYPKEKEFFNKVITLIK